MLPSVTQKKFQMEVFWREVKLRYHYDKFEIKSNLDKSKIQNFNSSDNI